jgi:hypothetical protein
MTYKLSIIATAHRPQNWLTFMDSLGKNDIDYEVIFVGPNKPVENMPSNFFYIYSLVKPAQCVEIAYRASSGNLILIASDDVEFVGEKPLDRLVLEYKKQSNYKVVISSKLMEDGKKFELDQHLFEYQNYKYYTSSHLLSGAGIISKKVIEEVGGFDKNFIAANFAIDLDLRIYSIGGKVFMSDVLINEKKSTKGFRSNTQSEYAFHDSKLLYSLWDEDENKRLFRNKDVEPYTHENIKIMSQGPRGRWRGTNFVIIEYLIDVPFKILKRNFRRLTSFKKYIYYLKKLFMS